MSLIPPEDVQQILTYLSLPPSDHLPSPPLAFLAEHLAFLPPSLLEPFSTISPRQRTSIPTIRSRRLIYASSSPPPPFLTAEEGRLRWPLLWERMGGDPLAFASTSSSTVVEEEDWVSKSFLDDPDAQQVKKLGGFLRGLEEEREAEGVRAAKRRERRLDDVGEEFDSESDEEEPDSSSVAVSGTVESRGGERPVVAEDQEEVKRLFEKRILELFLDGLDTISYDPIDFTDPPNGDPIAKRDAEDKYFDEEEPSRTPGGHEQGSSNGYISARPSGSVGDVVVGGRTGMGNGHGSLENGQGEYDY